MSQPKGRTSVSGRQLRQGPRDRSTLVLVGVILGVVAVLAIGMYAWSLTRPSAQHFADVTEGKTNHLSSPSDPLPTPYNSNPPTSGWHWGGGVADPGVKTTPISDTITVHNLEHGFVIFHYRSDLDSATVKKLEDLTFSLQQQNPCIIMEPRPADNLDVSIVATSWTYMLKLDSYDEAALRSFFSSHVGRDNPEKICPVGM